MSDRRLVSGEHAVLLMHGLSSSPLELRFVAYRLHEQGHSFTPHTSPRMESPENAVLPGRIGSSAQKMNFTPCIAINVASRWRAEA